ncbi:hypothetical protein B0J18DRAFT_63318 [Chaetomium sp. MPI-SDFR-AT-0129]|nr:hypothetical protein B0J18DRAFT_63318 [Chaetomium sp. MPI-SDFR-AT-0129]
MAEVCKSCQEPLTITLDPEDSVEETTNPQTVPDDLVLPCGCHFHWQCLLEESSHVTTALTCPACNTHLPTNVPAAAGTGSSSSSLSANVQPTQPTPHIPTHYTNEGGAQPNLDIYPTLLEESYLSAHPEARPARAFHTLAAEGQVQGMVELLQSLESNPHGSDDDDDNEGKDDDYDQGDTDIDTLNAAQLLAWRDPLNGLRSALHVALEAQQEEAVWLLLWLGSGARAEDFPPAVVQVVEGTLGLARLLFLPEGERLPGTEDVRTVRDERGRTAGDVCLELGGPWVRLVEGGLFQ